MNQKYFKEIAKLANQAFVKKEVPIGAIITDKNGQVIGRGYNLIQSKKDSTEHAEIRALKQAFKKKRDWRLNDCSLVVNLEPCLMCLGAIANARIKEVIYFLDDPTFGSVKSRLTKNQLKKLFPRLKITKVTDKGKTKALLQEFFKNLRNNK